MMKELLKGENILIKNAIDTLIHIQIKWKCQHDIDVSMFLLENEKIRNNQDFIYFNNNYTKAIKLSVQKNMADISIDISSLHSAITKLPIIITINDEHHLDTLEFLEITFNEEIVYGLETLHNEKAIILAQLYKRRDQWKYKIPARGFNSGLEKIATDFGLDLDSLSQEEKQKTFKKSPKDVIEEHTLYIKNGLKSLKPYIDTAVKEKYNESDTRMILDKIFMDVLGYNINELKTEQKIQGRRADYILSVNDTNYIVVEAKKAGMALREKQVFQATSYGAYSGIKWALLTNLTQWQLYYINSGDKIEPELVFCIDLDNLQKEELEMFFKISKKGILRKGLLEKIREKNRALSQANIISTLLTDNVLDKIRTTINKDSSYKVSNDEVQHILESFLNI